MQSIPKILPYLNDEAKPDLSNIFYKHIFNAIRKGISKERAEKLLPSKSFIFNDSYDYSLEVGVFNEFLSTGKSKSQEDLVQINQEKQLEGLNEEGKKKMKELLMEEVQIEFDPINIEDFGDIIYTFSETRLSTFLKILKGDLNLLDYQE